MHPEIEALAAAHRLPLDAAEAFDQLFARVTGSDSAATFVDDAEPAAPPRAGGAMPPRYEDLGRLGVGGMGEVRRVRDRELGRTCAYKAIRVDLTRRPNALARFVGEAQIGAQLQHPNIPPVYDAGRLPDGRPWFTMKEVRGKTFTEVIREVHAAGATDARLRRLCDILASVCDAVGYAHGRGVVHRDLKPENVMVGAHGEVYVLDWGLAKVVGQPDRALEEGDLEPEMATDLSEGHAARTRAGGVLGTAAYMPPEQARGEVDRLDARSDVYALGAILYEVLSGRAPYEGPDVLRQVLAGPAAPPDRGPDELVSLCLACLARAPVDRPEDATSVGAALRAWLDGATKRAKAREVVARAEATIAQEADLRAEAVALRAQGEALLVDVPAWAPEARKVHGWAAQDEAERIARRAALLELKREALLQGALTLAPDLAEAHAALGKLELERHRAAERDRDDPRAARAEIRLREHTDALPAGHPARVEAAAYLTGDGALTLRTDPPGAEVTLWRYELRDRRLVEVPDRALGRTPLVAAPLAMGSYLCVIRHPERAAVRYPVRIARGEHWHGVPPGEAEPLPVRLPVPGELGPDDCLVPAGWFQSGGDPEAMDSLPARRLWCDELVVKRFPVTNREYMAFLDDLVATGREGEALRHQPRERSLGDGAPVYGRDPSGRFVLRPDNDGDLWDPEYPVVMVDRAGAHAYAGWLAARTGRPWRLLAELEWEKAARGVDGRRHPWGDFADPSWSCNRASHPGRPLPPVVDSFPVDVSPYGVRGMAGNVQEWCSDVFLPGGGGVDGDRVVSARHRADPTSACSRRGGAWNGAARFARAASRSRCEPEFRNEALGFRLAYRPGESERAS